jgi:hypothetical protein
MEHNTGAHVISISTLLGSLMGIIPPITALVGLIYYLILISEKITGKDFCEFKWIRYLLNKK